MWLSELSIPITTALAGALSLWLLVLSATVIRHRRSAGVSLGDGQNDKLQRAIRAQGNLTEYAPLFTILIGIAELQQGNVVIVSTLAVLFLIGRLGHGYALAFTEKNVTGRVAGMVLTLTTIGLTALYALVSLVL